MRKLYVFFILICHFIILSGCNDNKAVINLDNMDNMDNGSSGNNVTLPDLVDIKTLHGTYDIDFYYSNVTDLFTVTNDCSMVEKYVSGGKPCNSSETESVEFKGEGTVYISEDNSLKIQMKMQMNGGVFNGLAGDMIPQKRYIFHDYNVIPSGAVSETVVNDISTGMSVKGIKGRNAEYIFVYDNSNAVSNDSAASTYEFQVLEDGTLVGIIKDKGHIMDADVLIRLKKKSDEVTMLEPNKAYDIPVIDNFNSSIVYSSSK